MVQSSGIYVAGRQDWESISFYELAAAPAGQEDRVVNRKIGRICSIVNCDMVSVNASIVQQGEIRNKRSMGRYPRENREKKKKKTKEKKKKKWKKKTNKKKKREKKKKKRNKDRKIRTLL